MRRIEKCDKHLRIEKIDITKIQVDCIVNAANSHLQQGSGVCGAIFRAAGARELQLACNKYGHCSTGSTVITPGFQLQAKYIVHAVGPRWQDGKHGEAGLLYSAYQTAMKLAYDKGCRSIAFPLISSGVYGYPEEQAWNVAIRAILDSPCNMDIMIAVIDDEMLALGRTILPKISCEKY